MISALASNEACLEDTKHSEFPHVLLIVDQFPKILGGGERIVLRLAALLPKYGYRASILTFFVHPECAGLSSLPCPVYVLPLQCTYNLKAFRAALELRQFLLHHEIRIVQTFFESSDIWAGLVTKLLSNAKLIWSRRDMGILRSGKHHAAYRLMAGVPDAVFAVSEQVRRQCIEVDRIEPDRVHTIYNGLDLMDWSAARGLARAPGDVRIVTVGNIRRVKGHDIFIKAAAVVLPRFPRVSFSIAGEVLDDEYFRELTALVHDLNLDERFRFLGPVKDTRKYLAEADIFVLPSRSEGFSNAIVEAMAASLVVVATDVGGNKEAVEDGVTGYVIPPEDPTALADAMLRLLSGPSQAMAMGVAGKNRVAEMFTTEAMMTRIVAIYASELAQVSN